MTKKSLALLAGGGLIGVGLIGAFAGTGVVLNQRIKHNDQQATPNTHLVINPNDPTPLTGLTSRVTKFTSQTPDGTSLKVQMTGLIAGTTYQFLSKTRGDASFTSIDVVADTAGLANVTLANYQFGQEYTYKLMQGETVVEAEYQSVVNLAGPMAIITTTSNSASVKFVGLANYSGLAGEKLQFEYKQSSERDFRVAIGPFDIPLNQSSFNLEISRLLPGREYQWKLSRTAEKLQLQSGTFTTKQLS